ncbi:MAG: twin-arginine translocase TatA/TatE family subunit [Chloroflexi bacterium]|nr:twin-arginine translocase TatA/TatE family subunit [Chloroflexota bacterium]
MPQIGLPELIIILVVVLLIFGSTKLPELARAMGKSIREFKKGQVGEGEDAKAKQNEPEKATTEPPAAQAKDEAKPADVKKQA